MRKIFILCGILLAIPLSVEAKHHRSGKVLHAFQRANPCPINGLKKGACPGYVKDHIVALCDGGEDAVSNLQWQTVAEARKKDRDECRRRRH